MKTGDTVLHMPTQEKWLVAYVDGKELSPCGWPACIANVSDCQLIKECSSEESRSLLEQVAKIKDFRGRAALHLLESLNSGQGEYI